MRQLNDSTAATQLLSNTDVAGGGDCVITIAAAPGERHTIDWIKFGYYDTPAVSTAIVITDGTSTLQAPMTDKGPGQFTYGVRGMQFAVGAAVTVTLEDGGQVKDLNLQYR